MNSSDTQNYFDLLQTYNSRQVIDQPAKISLHGQTLIDLFITSDLIFVKSTYIKSDHYISNHSVISCELDVSLASSNPLHCRYRSFKKFLHQNFLAHLQSTNHIRMFEEPNIYNKIMLLNNATIGTFNAHASINARRFTKAKAPWLTNLWLAYVIRLSTDF